MMKTWIEIRQERHTLGNDDRDDWSYGSALWSPTTNKAGSKIYELMKEPTVGDRVLHFYETGGVRYYHAHSKVIETNKVSYEIPTDPGSWSWAKEKKERHIFFARNPKLIKEAKRVHGYKCQACNFEFKNKYGEFGKDYIECHHENVLSERPEEEWNEFVKTSINDVKVLCSNCHRMVHHRRPALSFIELLELLKNEC